MRLRTAFLALLAIATVCSAQQSTNQPCAKNEWSTMAEATCYRTTPRYDDTMAYIRRVVQAAPKQIRVETFGKTAEGRDLVTVIVSRDGLFDPATLHAQNRPIVLVQNAIHAGEMDGKDASLALLRDIVVTKTQAKLIDRAVLVFIPIYNADGHERFGPYNRINQNGPEQMGWRTTSRNLNLNRDYMKADAPETRAFLGLWNKWLPDFFIDNHVTDGADYQYDITYSIEDGPEIFPQQAAWIKTDFLPYTQKSVEAAGHLMAPYVMLTDETDLSKGLEGGVATPRFSTGFGVQQNRPAMLVELHMMKDYRTRVTGNYEVMRAMFELINRDADKLVQANRAADAATVQVGRAANGQSFPLRLQATKETEPFAFKGFKYKRELSAVSGTMAVEYSQEPAEMTIPRHVEVRPTLSIAPPRAYIVPAQWGPAIEVLQAHGLKLQRTTKPWTSKVEVYRCETPQWSSRPFEGRHALAWPGLSEAKRACRLSQEEMSFPAGSVVVPMDQRAAKIAIHLLEPEGPDSFVSWGFFDTIFEQKEYGEGYVLEKLAREMMARDPKLTAEFEQRVESDKEFAASPTQRLNWFYKRSPWWDPELGRYPIARLATLDGVPL